MLSLIKQYLWALDLAAILLCSFFGAKLTSVYIAQLITVEAPVVKPAKSKRGIAARKEVPSFDEYKIIIDRNIFDSTELPPEEAPVIAKEEVQTGKPVKTNLKLHIFGVLVVGKGDDDRSSATIKGSQGIDTYAVGDKDGFAPNTKLTRVQPDRILFIHNNRKEYALIEDDDTLSIFGPPPSALKTAAVTPSKPSKPAGSSIKKQGEGKYVIDQREVENALANIERLYTEIRAVPNFSGGKVSGMKILSVKQGSLFDKLGLRRGDILEKINGLELDVKKGFEIFGQLKDQNHLTVDLIRQGAKKSFEYEIR